ncbi:MAG: VOC family protein [Cyclobacteriaceae bacterium]
MTKPKNLLIVVSILLLAFKSDTPSQQQGLLPHHKMAHIGIVVKDMDVSLGNWMNLLGLEERPNISIAVGHEDNPTQYRGKPSNAQAKLAFLQLENIEVELIEPIGTEPSHWREFLETKGEGVHHIAFWVDNLGEIHIDNFEKNGLSLAQHGGWKGGEYGYMDGMESLGVMVEILETYNK